MPSVQLIPQIETDGLCLKKSIETVVMAACSAATSLAFGSLIDPTTGKVGQVYRAGRMDL